MPQGFTRRAIGALLTATILLLLWRVSNYQVPSFKPSALPPQAPPRPGGDRRPRIGKVSMLYGNPNTLYERALQSHERHAHRWGCPMYILQEDISTGFWNKPSYLLSLVIQELAKPASKRLEWLMFVTTYNPSPPPSLFLLLLLILCAFDLQVGRCRFHYN